MLLIINYSFIYANMTSAVGIYNNWGNLTFRERLPIPIVFNSTIKASKSISFELKKNFKNFLKKHLELNYGILINYLTENKNNLFLVSIYPEIKYNFILSHKIKPFISWSIGGLTYMEHISSQKITFTFLDYVGIGARINKTTLSVRLTHYSSWFLNSSEALDVPFSIILGYEF